MGRWLCNRNPALMKYEVSGMKSMCPTRLDNATLFSCCEKRHIVTIHVKTALIKLAPLFSTPRYEYSSLGTLR